MVDHLFDDPDLAGIYELLHPWDSRRDYDFYLPLLLAADAALDVGCGTGTLLHGARQAGHTGRLCGLDPAEAMLARARARTDIEWVCGELSSVTWDREFDLIVMAGHAFQVFVTDEELRAALAAIHRALRPGGRFAFETRNPAARAWRHWHPGNVRTVPLPQGGELRTWHELDEPVVGELVRFTQTFTAEDVAPRFSRSTLRFVDQATLTEFLTAAGLTVERQFGDWDGGPLTGDSPEIITYARRAG